MYHKIYPESPTLWWVEVDSLYRHLCELRSKKVVYLDDYDPQDPDQAVITFDGVYQNVLSFAAPLLKKFEYPFELFITSDYIGKDNSFDSIDGRTGQPTGEPLAQFASKEELAQLVKLGGRLQWHSKSHANLAKLKLEKEILRELVVPSTLKKLDKKGFSWFAYPHGEFTPQVKELVKKHFSGALSVIQGSTSDRYALNRTTVTNQSSFSSQTIGVAIPSYNYGTFLVEAIESVLTQTRPVTKILIINDGSTDNTDEIASVYAAKYPGLIFYKKNPKNLGIVPTFNAAINFLNTEYVCLLGADNRFRSDYIEKTSAILDTQPKTAVAYTDFALFGPLASNMYALTPVERRGGKKQSFYIVNFPSFSPETAASLKKMNFMHGSSLYRRVAWQEVGGYQQTKEAEDYNLFRRMVAAGWNADRVAEPVLEYRQHSRDQVNTRLNSFAELKFYKDQYHINSAELGKIKAGKFWKLLYLYKEPKSAIRMYSKRLLLKVSQRIINIAEKISP